MNKHFDDFLTLASLEFLYFAALNKKLQLRFMKKVVLMCMVALFTLSAFAQNTKQDSMVVVQKQPTPKKAKKDWSKVNLSGRANDHFMIQYGVSGWAGAPDSIRLQGFSRHFNFYLMWDFPFRSDPRFSVALGLGLGSDNIFFKNTNVGINATGTPRLPFTNLDSANRYEKYKLVTAYLEAPVELRFVANPENSNKSFKIGLGVKLGQIINVHTKGVNLQDKNGRLLSEETVKVSESKFFNSFRFLAMARIGYGNFSLSASYQINQFLRDGAGPDIKPFTIGLTLSGL
jgi:Outer membrane protein beta-barrel domain